MWMIVIHQIKGEFSSLALLSSVNGHHQPMKYIFFLKIEKSIH